MIMRLSEITLPQFVRRHWVIILVSQALVFISLGIFIAGLMSDTSSRDVSEPTTSASIVTSDGPTIWTCSMHPQIRQPKSGKCPICGMDLIPVAKTSGGMRTLAISPDVKALMRISTVPVERRLVQHEVPMVGRVDYDETRVGHITAWVSGRLDRLYVDYTGVEVKSGDHMAYIYSEQLYSAQEELIQAVTNRRERTSSPTSLIRPIDLVESSREKLRLLGLKEEQIAEIEQQSRPTDHVTIFAPVSGIVIEKLKQQGDRVQIGERIYTIADLKQVWVHLDAYESDLSWIRYGQDVSIAAEAYPGDEFHGRVSFIQPVLNDKTRTVKVRVNVPNVNGKLKPEMFVRATVRPQIAADGSVVDTKLAGKWISPMHPEIVKDGPGACDICGMPLVRAESLGYVSDVVQRGEEPLVIPYSAALVTGTRAIVYVQLPELPSEIEPAFQTLAADAQQTDLEHVRHGFAKFAAKMDKPSERLASSYALSLWQHYADQLAKLTLDGQRAATLDDARAVFSRVETLMSQCRERFAPGDRPTFEGREIVLGPRAGNLYLVRHGLEEGELVVTAGNFKIDAEIQLQAKPSMMTPDGGGASEHDHGGHAAGGSSHLQRAATNHSARGTALTAEFREQSAAIEAAFDGLSEAVMQRDVRRATSVFSEIGQALAAVDASRFSHHSRMIWNEFGMLLGNDVVEGADARTPEEVDRVYLLLKGHLRRMRQQLGTTPVSRSTSPQLSITPQFQSGLGAIWKAYSALHTELAADDLPAAQTAIPQLASALGEIDDSSLDNQSRTLWIAERTTLETIQKQFQSARDIQELRTVFASLSQTMGVLASRFGFGAEVKVYELHCPMAFNNQGAVWYQSTAEVRNPYFGSTMLKCADRVELFTRPEPSSATQDENHLHN